MKQDRNTRKSSLICIFFLLLSICGVSISAQEKSAAPAQNQAQLIIGTVTDNKEAALAGAEVRIEAACDCQPCKDKQESCSVCCPPGALAPVATTTVDPTGSFSISLPSNIPPGLYSLKVLSGKFSRAVPFQVDGKDSKVDFKIDKRSDIKVDKDAATVGVIIPVGVGRG